MAREIDQGKLPEYRGKFSWVADTLCAHISATMPEYDSHDPKTWPVITSDYLQALLGHEYDGNQCLPPYVAYERGLVDKCVTHFADGPAELIHTDGQTTSIGSLYHYLFPFVYNSQGQARKFEYMHAHHYITWVSDITGTVPSTRTKGKDVPPSASTSAFTEVLKMLKETRSNLNDSDAETGKQELAKLRKTLAKEKQRVEAVRKSNQAVKEGLREALSEEKKQHNCTKKGREADAEMLETAHASWDIETGRANAAEKSVKQQAELLESKEKELRAAKAKMRSQAKELDAAKKEAATAQGQINVIRDELRKIRGIENRKRQANDDTPEMMWKRIKTEFEE
ncbi:hypothetical protein HBH56_028320 [Parastagonospora nodorum]|uniref:Uncharacterized protein n=1 Tax=Phaeosphaeria nodorum (strain SN15 / ATCC MYA-4574 / FGSC 10173) TaxID=321614 RepID=A0A7U2I0T9_PHANO|nr:hypothetical protein HBH56_028320 [Parastagonospora nodorum]QRC99105.1 hypothetical protein JI435_064460 [Parastagonospora nodorum SN15]KAH3934400.1 hypothetical protein HBH54_053720 [Parastagonospora nodorum]KAH3949894.1 hypothetical protein HBH53_081390 [Parastagonospora nodorum]KAH4039038.1 hypothetical protein HBI09_043120 [Parastagonospora nodorum]